MRRILGSLAVALSVAIGVPAAALANPFAPAAGALGSATPDGIELVKRQGGHVRHRAVHRARFAYSRRVHHRRYHRPRLYRAAPIYVRRAHWHCHRHFRYGYVIRHCHWHRFGHH